MKLLHSKKNNLGIIFECLLQSIVEETIKKNFDKKKDLLKIVKKYFFQNKYLREEFNIISTILNSEYKNKDDARRFFIECLKIIENLNSTLTERKEVKQKLLEDIYKVCDKTTFFNHNIPNYTIYATANLVLEYYSKNKKINEIKYLINLENKLIEHLVNNKIKTQNVKFLNELITESDNLTTLISVAKYREAYFNKLSKDQQELVEYYITSPNIELLETMLNKHYRTNYNKLRTIYNNEKIEFTKNKLKESLLILENKYKDSTIDVEDKLKIVLDSFELIK